jgi:hypothetical protein
LIVYSFLFGYFQNADRFYLKLHLPNDEWLIYSQHLVPFGILLTAVNMTSSIWGDISFRRLSDKGDIPLNWHLKAVLFFGVIVLLYCGVSFLYLYWLSVPIRLRFLLIHLALFVMLFFRTYLQTYFQYYRRTKATTYLLIVPLLAILVISKTLEFDSWQIVYTISLLSYPFLQTLYIKKNFNGI